MRVKSIDHVNLLTSKLPETVAFYRDVLGMRVQPPRPDTDPDRANWIWSEDGRPVIHLVAQKGEMDFLGDHVHEGDGSGVVHHVAFECADYDGFRSSLERSGHALKFNDVPQAQLRQIFIRDPNQVLVELNFR